MIKNVIFDLDGTLLDTSDGVFDSVRYTASQLGFPSPSDEILREFIGPPLSWSFIQQYNCDEEEAQIATCVFRKYYNESALFKARIYDGIDRVLEELKKHGIKVAVATNKPNRFAGKLLDFFNLTQYCDAIHGADETGSLSKADLIRLCLRDLKAEPCESLLVGDTANDAKGAEEVGLSFVAVTYGFGFNSLDDAVPYSTVVVTSNPFEILNYVIS